MSFVGEDFNHIKKFIKKSNKKRKKRIHSSQAHIHDPPNRQTNKQTNEK